MTRLTANVLGFLAGATVALLLAIAYDTSAQVAALEGGRSHLAFRAIIVIALISGAVGAGIANTLAARDERRHRR